MFSMLLFYSSVTTTEEGSISASDRSQYETQMFQNIYFHTSPSSKIFVSQNSCQRSWKRQSHL